MRKLYTFLAILLAILAVCHPTSATNPGVVASVNTNSLTKLIREVTPEIFEGLRTLPIPDVSGSKLGIRWWLSNIRVSSLDLRNTSVTAGDGIFVDFSQIDLNLSSNFAFKVWFFPTGRCPASAAVKGGGIKYRVYLHPGPDSRLKVDVREMHFQFPRARITFHGNFFIKIVQFIVNFFSGMISNAINGMRGKINNAMTNAMTNMLNRTILRIPVSNWAVMDFGLTKSVQYPNNNIIASFNGETTAINHKTPQQPRHDISLAPHANLLQFKFSSFFFNTFFESYYAARSADYKHTVDKSSQQKNNFPYPLALQAGDKNIRKWDAISPAIASKYTGKTLKIPMTLAAAPRITFTPGTIQLQVDPLISFTLEDGTELFSVRGRTNIATTATIAQNTQGYSVLLLQFKNLDIKFETVKSAIGPINFDTVNDITKFVNTHFVLPLVNALIGEGFPLPSSPALHFVNSQFKVEANALYLTSDIRYVRANARSDAPLSDVFTPRSPVFGGYVGDEIYTDDDMYADDDHLLDEYDDDQYYDEDPFENMLEGDSDHPLDNLLDEDDGVYDYDDDAEADAEDEYLYDGDDYIYDDVELELDGEEYYDEAEDLSDQDDFLFDEEEDLSEDVSSFVNEDDQDYDEYIVSMSDEDVDGESLYVYHNDQVILPGVTVN